MQDVRPDHRADALSYGAWIIALLLLLAAFGVAVALALLP
jgi:hypothetical protein